MQAFQQMLARLQSKATTQGPADSDESILAQAARAAKAGQPGQAAQAPHTRKPAPPLPKVTVRRELPKIGRNETVKIRKGSEVQEMKFKKAELLLKSEGWELVKEAKK